MEEYKGVKIGDIIKYRLIMFDDSCVWKKGKVVSIEIRNKPPFEGEHIFFKLGDGTFVPENRIYKRSSSSTSIGK